MRHKRTLSDDEIRAKLDELTDFDGPIPAHCPELGNCWVWKGATYGEGGYGYVWCNSYGYKVHRLTFELEMGGHPCMRVPLSPDIWVLHRCDDKQCRRLSHLFVGTWRENQADMISKGRQRGAPGESNAGAKLTRSAVSEIRARVTAGETQRSLAHEYNVSPAAICMAVNGQTWI